MATEASPTAILTDELRAQLARVSTATLGAPAAAARHPQHVPQRAEAGQARASG